MTHHGTIQPQRDATTLASNIDIAPTILQACGIDPPDSMSGLDLRNAARLKERNRVFVDVYEHDSNVDKLADLQDGLVARVVVDGWDKLVMRPSGAELFDLRVDTDDRNDVASQQPVKVGQLKRVINDWLQHSQPTYAH